jgi:hypothetical protein
VRVVTSPETAARLRGALDNALSTYHGSFGDIRPPLEIEEEKRP